MPATDDTFQSPSERLVFGACRNKLFSLWSYANPLNTKGNELCDVLVVCDPDVIVISVKHRDLILGTEPEVDLDRWWRKVVEGSVDEIYGAVRQLNKGYDRVIRKNGTEGVLLPSKETRRTHRISVSIGSNSEYLLPSGDFGAGFVHVFDEWVFTALMDALDTIADFVHYLSAREELISRRPLLEIEGEENLLAIYLHYGRRFPTGVPDPIPTGLWKTFTSLPSVQRRYQAEQQSYIWDRLIEYFCAHSLAGTFEWGSQLTDSEEAIREMARETRLGRRYLSQSFASFIDDASEGRPRVRARMLPSLRDGVGYVFMNAPPQASRQDRIVEMKQRTLIARGDLGRETIVGICMNLKRAPEGHCEELHLLRMPEWTPERAQLAQKLKSGLGLFAKPELRNVTIDEYPPE